MNIRVIAVKVFQRFRVFQAREEYILTEATTKDLTCDQVEQLWCFYPGHMTEGALRDFKAHVFSCEKCRFSLLVDHARKVDEESKRQARGIQAQQGYMIYPEEDDFRAGNIFEPRWNDKDYQA